MNRFNLTLAGVCLLIFSALPCAAQTTTCAGTVYPQTGVFDSSLQIWLPIFNDGFGTGPVSNCAPSALFQASTAVWSGTPGSTGGADPISTFNALEPDAYGTGTSPYVMAYLPGNGTSGSPYLSLPNFALTSQFTINLWTIQAAPIQPWYARLFEGGGSTHGFANGVFLGLNAANKTYQLSIADPDNSLPHELGSCLGGTPQIGQLTMITATFDGQNAYLYVNGQQVAGPCSFGYTPTTGLPSSARIGATNQAVPASATYGAYNGYINGFRYYARALSAAEVMQNYTANAR